MKLLVDLSSIIDERSGAGRRAMAIWPRVADRLAGRTEITVLAVPDFAAALAAASSRLRGIAIVGEAGRPLARALGLNRRIRALLARGEFDLVHQETLPLAVPGRTIFLIHDLRELHPRWRTNRRRRIVAGFLHALQTPRCPCLVTVSNFMAGEIRRLLDPPPERLHLVPNGVDVARFRDAVFDPQVLARIGLPSSGYLLHLGRLEPRKNLPFLVEVQAALQERGSAPPLVLAGAEGPAGRAVRRTIRSRGLADRVLLPGAIDEADLAAVYAGARLVLLPSLYEGYGIGALEARAAGRPVLASEGGPFPELLEARFLAPPGDVGAWAAAIERLLVDAAGSDDSSIIELPDWDEAARIMASILGG